MHTSAVSSATASQISLSSTSTSGPPQILLILVGLPGSGKTVLSQALVDHSPIPQPSSPDLPRSLSSLWVRASQDDAPRRRRQECEAVVREALTKGHSVIVDRVGFDPVQRAHFIRIAKSTFPRPLVYVLTLHASPTTLATRLKIRTSHPSLTSPELAIEVLGQMLAVFDPPRPGRLEGFDRIMELREEFQPKNGVWTRESVERLIGDIGKWGHQEVRPDTTGGSIMPSNSPKSGSIDTR